MLTACQLQGIPGAAAALYTNSSASISEQVAGFSPLLDIPITALTRRVSDDHRLCIYDYNKVSVSKGGSKNHKDNGTKAQGGLEHVVHLTV